MIAFWPWKAKRRPLNLGSLRTALRLTRMSFHSGREFAWNFPIILMSLTDAEKQWIAPQCERVTGPFGAV